MIFNDGSAWKSHRRFSLKALKDFGFGKSSLDHILIEEADRMGEFFMNQKNEPFLVQTLFNLVILNVLWTVVAGKRFELCTKYTFCYQLLNQDFYLFNWWISKVSANE